MIANVQIKTRARYMMLNTFYHLSRSIRSHDPQMYRAYVRSKYAFHAVIASKLMKTRVNT